jgi:hypothetical protein
MKYAFVLLVLVWGCGGSGPKVVNPDSMLTVNSSGSITLVNGDSAALYEFNHLISKTFRQYSSTTNPAAPDTMAAILDANWHDAAVKIHGKWHVLNDSAAIETLIGIIKKDEKKLGYK